MLPEKHKPEWFTLTGLDKLFGGMALYNSDRDEFYNVYRIDGDTVKMEQLSGHNRITKSRKGIENKLYEVWIPVEVST